MQVRVSYTVNASDDYRRAIRLYYGKDGLATRKEVYFWCRTYGDSMDQDLASSLEMFATLEDSESTQSTEDADGAG